MCSGWFWPCRGLSTLPWTIILLPWTDMPCCVWYYPCRGLLPYRGLCLPLQWIGLPLLWVVRLVGLLYPCRGWSYSTMGWYLVVGLCIPLSWVAILYHGLIPYCWIVIPLSWVIIICHGLIPCWTDIPLLWMFYLCYGWYTLFRGCFTPVVGCLLLYESIYVWSSCFCSLIYPTVDWFMHTSLFWVCLVGFDCLGVWSSLFDLVVDWSMHNLS